MAMTLPSILTAGLAGFALACAASVHAGESSVSPAQAQDQPQVCLAPAAWYTLGGNKPLAVAYPELLTAIARQDVVLLGEQHDNADHHHWQLQTLAALQLLRPQMVIGFESFPRRLQPVLDKWVAGELTVKQFLDQSEWEKVWSFPAELYLPLFQFARINRIPMAALNVERSLTAAITKSGWDAVPAAQKEGISRPAAPADGYIDLLFTIFKQHPLAAGKEAILTKTDPQFRFFVESQTTWDRAMAEALAGRLERGKGGQRPLVVGIAGGGHVRGGYGIPHQLRDLGVGKIGTLLPVDVKQDCKSLAPGYADAIFAIPDAPQDKSPPPRLGVQLEMATGGIKLAEIFPGSLAEKTGFKRDDLIVAIAGAEVTKISSVIAAIRAQPAGTWLPVQIRRGSETIELVIKFPPQ